MIAIGIHKKLKKINVNVYVKNNQILIQFRQVISASFIPDSINQLLTMIQSLE